MRARATAGRGARASRYTMPAAASKSDQALGGWVRSELLEMQERFEQAIARELRPKR